MKQVAGQKSLSDYFHPRPPPPPKRKGIEFPPSLPPSPKRQEMETLPSSLPLLQRQEMEQSPFPPPSPERNQRAQSFISISSGEDESSSQEIPTSSLCREQQDLLNLIMSDKNVFFTGSAGCGKSTVLKAAISQLRAKGKTVHVTAPTGRAALNVDGITLYSYMGWNTDDVESDLFKLKGKASRNKNLRKSLRDTDVLIIDEISMVDNNFLSRMEEVLRHVRKFQHGDLPWGGLQLIVTGDFCQLPPVLPFAYCWICGKPRNKWKINSEVGAMCSYGSDNSPPHGPWNLKQDRWAFKSPAWEATDFSYVNLKEIHRQSDRPFIKTLQRCRLGITLSDEDLDILLPHEPQQESQQGSDVEKATQLVCTREEANEINAKKLAKITAYTSKTYTCEDGVWVPPDYNGPTESVKQRKEDNTLVRLKEHRFNPKVELKQTQLVMLQVNLNLESGLANGSQGVIVGWEQIDIRNLPEVKGPNAELKNQHVALFTEEYMRNYPEPEDQVWPVVEFHDGYKKTIYPVCLVHSVNSHSGIQIFRTQIPLIPGWAITIHKSQGMTLERAIVTLHNAFEVGQAYVALSRVTSLEGLHIKGGRESLSNSLSPSLGKNSEVHEFLKEKFGNQLYADREGSRF